MAMGSMIDYVRRFLGTALSFIVYGIGGIILSVVVFPLIAVFTRDKDVRTRRVRSVLSRSYANFIWLMHTLGAARFEVDPRCREKLSRSGGLIVVANHPTLIDVIQLLAQIEHGNCIVKKAMWNNPFLGGVVRAASYIPNNDSEQLLAQCAEVLSRGETLVIFPEATRTVPGEEMKLHRGAAHVAIMSAVPVQLVHLSCEPPTLSKAEHWYQIPPQRPYFKMTVGDTLRIGDILIGGESRSLASRRLTRVLQRKLSNTEPESE
jgi:1-acyl-sn-glycerol-3-phosphate acyltransferase